MKLGQLIEYNVRNIFLDSCKKNEAETLVPGLFSFFKALYEVKAKDQHLNMFSKSLTRTHNKYNVYKISDYCSRDMLSFLEKCWDLFPPHFAHDFSRKIFLLYSNN